MRRFFIVLILLFSSQIHALEWKEDDRLSPLFKQFEANGTFVLYDVSTNQFTGHNKARAETRFVPASTFKIAHTLIGLSVGAVSNVDEVLPYGGQPQPIKSWEQDMGLREAIKVSNVPIYQELARRIGLENEQKNLSKLKYGNEQVGKNLTTFWLVGPLKISAIEQTQFLADLAQEKLPYPQPIQKAVQDIIELEKGDHWVLYGKTGWENAPNPGVGWWVGWVKKEDRIYTFALNMDIEKATDASKRVELAKACLKTLSIL